MWFSIIILLIELTLSSNFLFLYSSYTALIAESIIPKILPIIGRLEAKSAPIDRAFLATLTPISTY